MTDDWQPVLVRNRADQEHIWPDHWARKNGRKIIRVKQAPYVPVYEGSCECEQLSVHPDDVEKVGCPGEELWIAECQILAD